MGQERTSNIWLLYPLLIHVLTSLHSPITIEVAKMAKLMIALIFDDEEEESVQN